MSIDIEFLLYEIRPFRNLTHRMYWVHEDMVYDGIFKFLT